MPFSKGENMEVRNIFSTRVPVLSICDNGCVKSDFKDACDINVIVRKHVQGQDLPLYNQMAEYGDFTQFADFEENMNNVVEAKGAFMNLPAHVRDRFSNDPQKFFDFALDPSNEDEMIKLGIAYPKRDNENTDPVIPSVPDSVEPE